MGFTVHKALDPYGLNARVRKECSNESSPILAFIFNESLARVMYQWRQANVSMVFKKGEKQTGVAHMHLLPNPRAYTC